MTTWWTAADPRPMWPAGGVLPRAGLGADAHLGRAAARLSQAEPVQWRAAAARAFVDRVAGLVAQVHALAALVEAAEVEVTALEVELAAARAALHTGPWWAPR